LMQRVSDSIEKVGMNAKTKKYYDFAVKDLKKIEDKAIVAGLLNNLQMICDDAAGQTFISSSNYGPFVQEFWPVVTAWYPEFPLKDLVSVQTMDKPLAYLFFTQLLAGTNKSPQSVGDIVETATGRRILKGVYPTGEITGETLVTADFQYNNTAKIDTAVLAYYPIRTLTPDLNKFLIVVQSTNSAVAGTYTLLSVVGNTINFVNAHTSPTVIAATIDIPTGTLIINEAAGATASTLTSVSVNYVWQIETADQTDLPTITEDIQMVSMEAIPRALALKWTIFSEYVKKAQFGADIRTATTKRILDLLYFYQCRYILDQMWDYATGNNSTPQTITISSAAITVEAKAQLVLQQLNVIGNQIAAAVGRMAGNRIVCGNTFKSFLESLPNTLYIRKGEGQGYVSPRELGEFGNYKVYYDPNRADGDAMMTYRGEEWCDAVYYVGEFMPMIPTDAVVLGVNVRAAFCSMEAYFYQKPFGVFQLSVVLS